MLAIPPERAAELTEQVSDWLTVQHAARYAFSEVAELVVRLAAAGFEAQALLLGRRALGIVRPLAGDDVEVNDTVTHFRAQPEAVLGHWEFDQFLGAVTPTLIERYPLPTTRLLADVLGDALSAEFGPEAKARHKDMSYAWCDAVEADAERPVYEYKQALVPPLREAALAASRGNTEASEVVMLLRGYGWTIHTRVALLVAQAAAESAPRVARDLLLDHELFERLEFRHEYSGLAAVAFPRLEGGDEATLLSWIDEGPSYETTDEHAERWKRDRLMPIKDFLPGDWRSRYDEMAAVYGEPGWEADHVMGRYESWIGPTSPLNASELSQLSIADVIERLRTWQPSKDWRSPSREGLGRIVTGDVPNRPEQYATSAEAFADLGPTYARSLISGLRSSVDKLRSGDLPSVLALATRIVDGRVPDPERASGSVLDADEDADWRNGRLELAHLLEAVCAADLLDSGQDEATWHCLSTLLDDPDPAADEEAAYGESMGPVNYSINTVRGQAVHATARMLGHLRRTDRLQTPIAAEVKAAMLRSVDDASVAVRAAVGMHFFQLLACEVDQPAVLVERVFSDDGHGRAAWASFLRFNSVSAQTMKFLWPTLQRAITAPDWQQDVESLSVSLRLAIALHVAAYPVAGDLLELVRVAWEASSTETRSNELISVGNQLSHAEAGDAASRVAEVIDLILDFEEHSPIATAEGKRSDLESVGWILTNDRLPIEWTIRSLRRLLALDALPMDPEDVIKRLAEAMPREDLQEPVLACIEEIVRVDRQNWAVYAAREAIAEVLYLAHTSGRNDVKDRAQDLQSKLLAAGRFNPDWLTHGRS
jgi:hypothetical protein